MALSLKLVAQPTVPLEVEGIVPDRLSEMTARDVADQQIFHGNEKVRLGDFFQVEGGCADRQIHWEGDLATVHWIGAKMQSGSMHIDGDAGRHLGSEMSGGEIRVDGDAGDWVGGEMKQGLINVKGRAGHLVGAAYRGSRRGMTGGTILIGGDAGNEIGLTMRRGLIAIGGDIGDLAGFNMLAGTLLIFGNGGIRHGAGMKRGTIGFCGSTSPKVLPSFRYGCRFRPPMLELLMAELSQNGFPVADEIKRADYDLYHGDMIEGGRGEFLSRAD